MLEAEVLNQIDNQLADLGSRTADIRQYLDYDGKKDRLEEVSRLVEDPTIWEDPKRAQELGREKKALEDVVLVIDSILSTLADSRELFDMGRAEEDDDTVLAVRDDLAGVETRLEMLEFRRMLEGQAAEWAAERATDADLQRLEQSFNALMAAFEDRKSVV